MSCTRFGPAIAAHAAGAAIEPAAGRHLGACAACRLTLNTQVQLLAELDGELGRTLSISASPGFTARVARAARDARRAPAGRWIPSPVRAGLGVAAAILLSVWIRQAAPDDETALRPKLAPARPRPEDVLLRPEPTEARKASAFAAPLAAAGRSTTHPANRRRNVSPGPPVIVEPSRALAIQRLRELMIEGRLDQRMLPPPATPETVLAELTIAPLEIADIPVRDVEIAGRLPGAPERQ